MRRALVVGPSYESPHLGMACQACARALKSLGWDAYVLPSDGQLSKGWLGRIEGHYGVGPGIRRINQYLMQMFTTIRPEVLLVYNATSLLPATVAKIAREGWISSYYHDNPFGEFAEKPYTRAFLRAIPYYNSHHVIREENISQYKRLGVEHVRLLRSYYIPWIHYPRQPLPMNGSAPPPEVVFIGHCENDHRIKYATAMIEAGVPLRLYGSPRYWHDYLPKEIFKHLRPITPVVGDQYAQIISDARISLAFFSGGNRDRYGYRVFEIPACGGFLLAERTELMQTLYEEGQEAEYFGSPEELIDKVRFYLRHQSARDRIATKGYQRCTTSGYDVITRMRQWVTDIEELSNGRAHS